ncbi:MAG: hypothetical protein NTW86_04750 [Candidatus Sumerlaeota bacterium]|nr:hypothetical protein [Candidatus Sumerlaeota bacterium]
MALAAAVLAAGGAQAVTVTDLFSTSDSLQIFKIALYQPAETPRASTAGLPGNKWGGWCPSTGYADKIGITSLPAGSGDGWAYFAGNADANLSGALPRSYIYTIFSSSGGGSEAITSTVNLGAVSITFKGSVPADFQLRLLIRDGDGHWLISQNAFAPSGGALNIPMTGVTGWLLVPGTELPSLGYFNMDLMTSDPWGPRDISTASVSAAANLNGVGGGGIYIQQDGTPATQIAIEEISFVEDSSVANWKDAGGSKK